MLRNNRLILNFSDYNYLISVAFWILSTMFKYNNDWQYECQFLCYPKKTVCNYINYYVRMLSRPGYRSESDPRVLYKKICKSPKHGMRGFHSTGERLVLTGVFTGGPYLRRGEGR